MDVYKADQANWRLLYWTKTMSTQRGRKRE